MILFFCKLFPQGSFFLAELLVTDRQERTDGEAQGCTNCGTGFLSLDALALFFFILVGVIGQPANNAELHDQLIVIVKKLCELFGLDEDDVEDRLDDDWTSYGEIILNGSVRFATKNIPAIKELANQLAALLGDFDSAEIEFEVYAVSDGEGDYDFASVAIEKTGNFIVDAYCRF